MNLLENADRCLLPGILILFTCIKASWKYDKSPFWGWLVGVVFVFKLWARAREAKSLKNKALKFRFVLLIGKGLFDNNTTFTHHSQTAMNDASEHLCGVNSWDSLTEMCNENRKMGHSEPATDHIQIFSTPDLVPLTSFEPARWQLSKHRFKSYERGF